MTSRAVTARGTVTCSRAGPPPTELSAPRAGHGEEDWLVCGILSCPGLKFFIFYLRQAGGDPPLCPHFPPLGSPSCSLSFPSALGEHYLGPEMPFPVITPASLSNIGAPDTCDSLTLTVGDGETEPVSLREQSLRPLH